MDETPKKKPLSEIGHLFLSSVREKQLGGAPAPKRTPPKASQSIDLTPEEFASVGGTNTASSCTVEAAAPARRTPPVTAIIGEHLNGKQLARVKEYARHLSNLGSRVGLIELDASEFRLMCFEPAGDDSQQAAGAPVVEQTTDCYDPRMMAEAIEELNFDVDRWLLMIPNPRVPEAQPLLKLVDHWVLLSTCDHDGVVSSYRTLKGLAEVHRPRLSLAVLDAIDTEQADKVYKKLAGVCEQFLDRRLEAEPPVRREHKVCEHVVMLCRPNRDKAQLANPPQWGIVGEFLVRNARSVDVVQPVEIPELTPMKKTTVKEVVADMVVPTISQQHHVPLAEVTMAEMTTTVEIEPAAAAQAPSAPVETLAEVVDLPSADASAEQIVNAVLKQGGGSAMLECPVRPPMCADARLAVTRDRSVVLLAVAKRGLAELNAIGQAYRWLIENRSLIGMAVPQLSIDPAQAPRLRLLVDQCDAGAEVLQPMLTGEHVAVQSYRRVKWGAKAGLLLEAA
jgi:hypothetical protein